ncbi:Ig-like domain-containing protein [Amorphus coralli]|uniref:Ig-like domain-containing protein n=1 Tax=Amorphus coralli TaxID=340680 RepID=UPI0004290BFB|nr:Ig-like domain-containing protein [Amorphus coralli]
MNSRSSGGAILFLLIVLGIGLYVAFQPEAPAPSATQTATPTGAGNGAPEAGTDVASASETDTETETAGLAPSGPGDDATDAPAAGDETPATTDGQSENGTAAAARADSTGSDEAGTRTASEPEPVEKTVTTIELQTPSYDIVRVEPSGEAVIAGRASPGATIVLEANGTVIGQTTANANGEWVIVLEEPLKPGNYDIAVRASHEQAEQEKASVERLAVSIPHDKSATPLVAVTRPNAPDTIIQKPEPAASQVASADTAGSDDATQSSEDRPAGDEGSTPAGNTVSSDGGEVSGSEETVIGTLKVREETLTEPAVDEAAAPSGGTDAVPSADDDADAAQSASEPSGTVQAADQPDSDRTGTQSEAVVASADASGRDAGAAPASMLPVSIESAEADTGHFRVSGTSEPGTDVWVYLGGEFVGEATAGNDGRWQFEAEMAFERGESNIRADQVTDAKGSVAARAEVPFGYRPAPEKTVASAQPEASAEPDAAPEVEVVGETEEGVRVLIRRGDNLWTVAHHFYGDGFNYTSIYQANGGQIRDPHLIYPGQVFTLPGLTKKDVTGEAERRAL